MIVVKIELHGAVTGNVRELGRMLIGNDGTGDGNVGNYDVKVLRRGGTEDGNPFKQWHSSRVTRTGRVPGYRREALNIWCLVARALLSAFPEEQP